MTIKAKIILHQDDIPESLNLNKEIAIDTEAMGLNPHRDRLCLVQLTDGEGRDVHLVHISPDASAEKSPNLTKILFDPEYKKIFHFARFDVAILQHTFSPKLDSSRPGYKKITNIFCTKIASRLAMTFSRDHGLKDLCYNLLGVRLNKEQQTSDWGKNIISPEQKEYAANDVIHLHRLAAKLQQMLERENRTHMAEAAFAFLPYLAEADLMGWSLGDIFSH